jgi:hypothetical protein
MLRMKKAKWWGIIMGVIIIILSGSRLVNAELSLFFGDISYPVKQNTLILDEQDSGGQINLQFGKTLNERLYFDPNGISTAVGAFVFTNRVSMENSVISFNGHFDVLQPPPSYDLTKKLDMQDIYSIVDIARRKYHLLIFDLPNQINDIFLGVLDMADLAIMVSDYTSGSIGRLANINKRFIYNDMERILVLNKNNNNGSHSFIKNNISEFFSLKEIVNINENPLLSGKSDFKECDFSNNKDMQSFKNKVMDSLTCD